ncbi:MAG: hypothetical protein DCC75_08995 [Proteobacteria bacterium]|nr:MAG: hypothetical protein DCC75_08995 [Pseudomonadota bacterium]
MAKNLQIDEVLDSLEQSVMGSVAACLEEALSESREAAIQRAMIALQTKFRPVSGSADSANAAANGADWVGVESLSRLRAIVGGRFQNLKQKWIEAGLPLRERKGQKIDVSKVNEKGWIELSNWILKQNFEARLTLDNPEHIFELRSVGSKK